jgi:hypothetical protein
MNDCNYCPVEKECFYPYKVCDCVLQRKFTPKSCEICEGYAAAHEVNMCVTCDEETLKNFKLAINKT